MSLATDFTTIGALASADDAGAHATLSPCHLVTPSPCHKRRAVFLDRDGVINRDSPEYIKSADELVLLPGSAEAIARLNAAGYACVVITNQSGVARGMFGEDVLAEMHAELRRRLAEAGAELEAVYHCPHLPDAGCDCRKPSPGLPNRAAQELGLDLAESWFVGDRAGDIACGAAAGTRTILVLTGHATSYEPAEFSAQPHYAAQPHYVCGDLAAAADIITGREAHAAPREDDDAFE